MTRFKKYRENALTWLKHPGTLLVWFIALLVFFMTITLTFPCGKYSSPHKGVCDSGARLMAPLDILVFTTVIYCIFMPFVIVSSRRTRAPRFSPKNFVKALLEIHRKLPEPTRSIYLPILNLNYLLLSLLVYFMTVDAGLRWYHLVVRFFIVIPLVAYISTVLILSKLRDLWIRTDDPTISKPK